jgi:hypothetical protein
VIQQRLPQRAAYDWSISLTFQKKLRDDLQLEAGPVKLEQLPSTEDKAARHVRGVFLLPHHANHRRTGVDHVEFTRRCTAQVDDSAPTRSVIRTTTALPL